MSDDLEKQINRAKELLATCRHACMATVNEDGSPHNTPFRFIPDPKLEYIYWGSHLESLHSLNVLRTGKIFVVLYDAIKKGGVYIKAEKGHALSGEELEKALLLFNSARAKEGSEPLATDYYSGNISQRMWSAKITNFWVNNPERDANGHMKKDGKHEVTAEDLLTQ